MFLFFICSAIAWGRTRGVNPCRQGTLTPLGLDEGTAVSFAFTVVRDRRPVGVYRRVKVRWLRKGILKFFDTVPASSLCGASLAAEDRFRNLPVQKSPAETSPPNLSIYCGVGWSMTLVPLRDNS